LGTRADVDAATFLVPFGTHRLIDAMGGRACRSRLRWRN